MERNKKSSLKKSLIIHFAKVAIVYLPPVNIDSFLITPTHISEVFNIISSLKLDKSDGPKSIPTRILKLLKKDTSDQLAIPFNQSFSPRIFS